MVVFIVILFFHISFATVCRSMLRCFGWKWIVFFFYYFAFSVSSAAVGLCGADEKNDVELKGLALKTVHIGTLFLSLLWGHGWQFKLVVISGIEDLSIMAIAHVYILTVKIVWKIWWAILMVLCATMAECRMCSDGDGSFWWLSLFITTGGWWHRLTYMTIALLTLKKGLHFVNEFRWLSSINLITTRKQLPLMEHIQHIHEYKQ